MKFGKMGIALDPWAFARPRQSQLQLGTEVATPRGYLLSGKEPLPLDALPARRSVLALVPLGSAAPLATDSECRLCSYCVDDDGDDVRDECLWRVRAGG